MAWTYSQLASSFAALSPMPSSLSSAVETLNAQTVSLMNQNVIIQEAFSILVSSSSGDWAKVVLRSRESLSGSSSPTAADNAVIAAIQAVSLLQSGLSTIETSNSSIASLLESWLSSLASVGDISSSSVSGILSLSTAIIPMWQPAIQVADLQACQQQGLIV